MRKKIIKIIILVLVVSIITFGIYYKMKNGNVVTAEIHEVVYGSVSDFVEETGTVKSRSQRIVYADATGEIKNIHVTEGDVVSTGDLIAEVDSEKLELEIKSLEAQIEGLRATYKEAIKPVDKEKIAKAQASVDKTKVLVDEAKRNLENSKKLYESQAISHEAYKAAQENLTVQENTLKIEQNELRLLKKGVSGNIKNQYEAQIAQLVYQKEILVKSKEDLMIKAPVSGTITEVFLKEGAYVQQGTNVIEIGDTKDLYIEVDVLASEVGDIKEDGLVIIYSEDLGIDEIKGKVDKIYPKAFSKVSDLGIEQKRVRIEAGVPENSKLKIGYEVDSKFKLWSKSDILVAPDNTVFDLNDSKYVFIVENNIAELRKIETGLEGEDYIEIKSGLKEGDKIIVSPNEDIEEGIRIKEEK
ncbi:efflux RND transporter periplasmic adaptor subunit [Wukongibacter baidiensis]|uniref:efflux RND transporter periplasmic adaptor subunit n=1 Tax=Wukongibacter baidiensis TaxID=1723361 RepID=UPI003D7FC5DA